MSAAPVLFVAHGSPLLALDAGAYGVALRGFANRQPRPRAIVVASAHAQEPGPVRVGAHPAPPTVHDFGGFPRALAAIRYLCPGDPELAAAIARRLGGENIAASVDPDRGLDHGAWVPLRELFPAADVPVVPLSLPAASPDELGALGRALAPLRDEGCWIVGSGGLVHNLRKVHWDEGAPAEAWATAFDAWVAAEIGGDGHALFGTLAEAPGARESVPTREHFDPLLVVLGARRPGDRPETLFEGWQHGNLSLRSIAFVAER